MNKIKLLFPFGMLIGSGCFFTACHTDYLAYEEPKDRVYFSRDLEVYNNYFTFPYWESGEQASKSQNFYVMGFPSEKDREVRVELVDSLTTAIEGEDYTLEKKFIIPAGEIQATLPVIKWNRRKDEDTRPEILTVGVCITENENFMPTMGYIVKLTYQKTEITEPKFWANSVLGPFSPGLLYRFLDQYASLKTSAPEAYNLIYVYAGEHWQLDFWPNDIEFLIKKFIMVPLYNYYQANPEPGVMIPNPN